MLQYPIVSSDQYRHPSLWCTPGNEDLLEAHRTLRAAPVAKPLAVARVDVDGLVAVARAPGPVVDVAHALRLHLRAHGGRMHTLLHFMSPKVLRQSLHAILCNLLLVMLKNTVQSW